eukprot:SAG11_NODE_144_length_14830_cov_17.955943_10_plen_38_part_00
MGEQDPFFRMLTGAEHSLFIHTHTQTPIEDKGGNVSP